MSIIDFSYKLAKEIGGKDGLNCIEALDAGTACFNFFVGNSYIYYS